MVTFRDMTEIRRAELEARHDQKLESLGLESFPKTSGSKGIHVNVRIEPRWGFDAVRRAALAVARYQGQRLARYAAVIAEALLSRQPLKPRQDPSVLRWHRRAPR